MCFTVERIADACLNSGLSLVKTPMRQKIIAAVVDVTPNFYCIRYNGSIKLPHNEIKIFFLHGYRNERKLYRNCKNFYHIFEKIYLIYFITWLYLPVYPCARGLTFFDVRRRGGCVCGGVKSIAQGFTCFVSNISASHY